MSGTSFPIEIQPQIPERLKRLEELAQDLLYSWDRRVRGLFVRLDKDLWESCGHNPKVFLRRVAQDKLNHAAADRVFLEDYNRALSAYDTYHQEKSPSGTEHYLDAEKGELVAYFCAEFGLHESLPIYSGGLGILAGDHCKAASDLGIPFVAVGMLYRQGYFTQTINDQGQQVAHYHNTDFADLPIVPARNPQGAEIHVQVGISGRPVMLKVWRAKAGHIQIILLDSDLPENSDKDRFITHRLYGGDITTRIQQEIVLGIGGVRALRALDLHPTVWHINEGHAAFQILERCRELVKNGLEFTAALEQVAAGTVFTTHTPVPAGHDIFNQELMHAYFSEFVQHLGISMEAFLKLGASPSNHGGFNQTALALRGSRFHNGVSRIHGGVASRMESYIWPQLDPEDNPIGYITNGIHVPTFLAREWMSLFDMRFGGEWRNELINEAFWQRIDDIPNHSYWSHRQSLKSEMLNYVHNRIVTSLRRNGCGEAHIKRLTRHLSPANTDTLILGFARRFATYKRAGLLFSDPERLARLLNNPNQPCLLIFAGKAHPHDAPGQHLIKLIHDYSRNPKFEGKIILLEGYDLALGRKLVTGVDVWVNTPEYPLEASGTSGQKAGINGVINLSVLDGWWGEGYQGNNGWAITPHGPQYEANYRNREEGQELLDIIEHEVIPLFYQRNSHGYPENWVSLSKASMKSTIPHFNSMRMVMEYVTHYYAQANHQYQRLQSNHHQPARELAQWKEKVHSAWPKVQLRRLDTPTLKIKSGEYLPVRAGVHLNSLDKDDVVVECLIGTQTSTGSWQTLESHILSPSMEEQEGLSVYSLDLRPSLSGLHHYKIRAYPFHRLLTHRFETGYMLWV